MTILKVQRGGLIIILTLFLCGVFSPQQTQAQMLDWDDEVLPVLALGLVTGVAMPAVPSYFGYSREYSYVLVPLGTLMTLMGMEEGLALFGAPIMVGGIYLYIDNKRAPLPQLTNHYILNVASIFTVAFMSGEMDWGFQPIVTPAGAGFRYRF